MSTQLERTLGATPEPQAEGRGVVDLIRRMTPEIQRALPRHLDADRMARLALTELRRTPALQRASAESLLGALMWAAQLGLEPGPLGHVYLVPRTIRGQVEVVFVIGYRGLVELAYRSGQVADLHARVVWSGETFHFHAGDDERVTHEPNLSLDPTPDEFVAAYAIAHLRGGGVLREVIGPRHIARAQAGSSIPSGKGPWSSDFEAMARKTAIRRLSALLPQSAELAAALNVDGAIAPRLDAGSRFVRVEDAEPAPPQVAELDPPEGEPVDVEPPPSEDSTESQETGEVVNAPVGEPISKPQSRRMHALMRERGMTDRSARLAWTRIAVGRVVSSSSQLTSREADRVIELLELSRPSIPDASATTEEGETHHPSGAAAEATPETPPDEPKQEELA